jgi:hypothetical protein
LLPWGRKFVVVLLGYGEYSLGNAEGDWAFSWPVLLAILRL